MKGRAASPTADELERIRLLYAGDTLTGAEISAQYGQRPNWINYLVAKHGWPKRGKHWRPGMPHAGGQSPMPKKLAEAKVRRSGPKPRTMREIVEQRQADDAARQLALYGDAIDDVRYLLRRGFVITREGAGVRVGNKLATFAELTAMAARERRLAGSAPAAKAVSARHIGHTEPLVPKALCGCGRPATHLGRCHHRRVARAPAADAPKPPARIGRPPKPAPTCTACGNHRSRWSKGLCETCARKARRPATTPDVRIVALEAAVAEIKARLGMAEEAR